MFALLGLRYRSLEESQIVFPTGSILQSKDLLGLRIINLAGHNGIFEESLTLSGEDLVRDTRYCE
jgi:hypothetical protein